MPRYLEILSRPSTVLLVVGILIIVNGFLFYRHQVKHPDSDEASSGDKETTSAAGPSTESGGARYVENVGDIQHDAVQTFTRINDMVGRYDTLTVDDVETIETNRLALEAYSAQAEDLDVPKGYKGQHKLFSGAIGDLYAAAEIAQRVTTAPTSATPADFKEYDNWVAEATSGLKQSNEALGQDYSTTEGFQKVGSLAFNERAVLVSLLA
jgi:hypothetical protein